MIESDDEFYIFKGIKERLLCKFGYNRLVKTGEYNKECNFLKNISIKNDGYRKKGANGTIINIFDNNYNGHNYIEFRGIKKELGDFLNNKSYVCTTLWGHGGVGKTATVQNLCEELLLEKERRFDYIVFASVKDRIYNCYSGEIEEISSENTFESIVKLRNKIMVVLQKFNENKKRYDYPGEVFTLTRNSK